MKKARITLHPDFRIGEISGRLFGAFLEPIGSMVNGSMYNPKHPEADGQGMRKDFYGALREAGLPAVRLPGGNFVSGWQWKDSIGPMEQRKTHLDMAWFQYIPNDVGHDEYLQWAEKAGAEAIYTVNLGTGTLQDAADCVEYTNFEGGTWWSDLRRKNGHPEPYGVKTWCLGNEMDGPWQIASWEKNPRGYGVLAHEASKAMKWVDPSIETMACVSSSPFLSHYPDWDREVLEECYSAVDYISLHHYHSAPPDMPQALLAGYQAYEDYIRTEIALCDYVKTKLRSKKTMLLALDEYAGMIRPRGEAHLGLAGRQNAEMFGRLVDPADAPAGKRDAADAGTGFHHAGDAASRGPGEDRLCHGRPRRAVRHGPGACMERRGVLPVHPDDPLGKGRFPGVRSILRLLRRSRLRNRRYEPVRRVHRRADRTGGRGAERRSRGADGVCDQRGHGGRSGTEAGCPRV